MKRFGVFDAQLSDEDRRRFDLRELARRLRDGDMKPTDRVNAARKLELLAAHPAMLAVLGERASAPDVYHWLAYHALVCKHLAIGDRQRVASFWRRSPETVQDALTDRAGGLSDSVSEEITGWRQQGFSPAEILRSLEETRLKSAREFILGTKRRAKAKRRKK